MLVAITGCSDVTPRDVELEKTMQSARTTAQPGGWYTVSNIIEHTTEATARALDVAVDDLTRIEREHPHVATAALYLDGATTELQSLVAKISPESVYSPANALTYARTGVDLLRNGMHDSADAARTTFETAIRQASSAIGRLEEAAFPGPLPAFFDADELRATYADLTAALAATRSIVSNGS